jgi:hypothetical protein
MLENQEETKTIDKDRNIEVVPSSVKMAGKFQDEFSMMVDAINQEQKFEF